MARKECVSRKDRGREKLEKRESLSDAREPWKGECDSVLKQKTEGKMRYQEPFDAEYDEGEIEWESISEDTSHNREAVSERKKENHEKVNVNARNQLVKELIQVGKKEFVGVLVSIGLTVVSCFVLFMIKVLEIVIVPYVYELYLCGILAMALVGAGMFAYSLHKKRQEWKEICQLQGRNSSKVCVEPRSVCMVK